MKNRQLKILFICFFGILKTAYSQDSTSQMNNKKSFGKYGEIGNVVNLNLLSLNENFQARLSYLVNHKNDTLYTLLLATYNSNLGSKNMTSPGALLQFNSDTLSLGRIKNHIKDAFFKEQQLPTPIIINNSTVIVMKIKKDLNLSIINNVGIFPTSVTLSKKDFNKLFGDKFLE
jgi:hypothetical protein